MTPDAPPRGLTDVIAVHVACSCPALLDTSIAVHVAAQVRAYLAGVACTCDSRRPHWHTEALR